MARKVILETAYTFTPSTKTIVIPRYIAQEKLALITNVTTGKVIYNFSDPSLKAASYSSTVTGATGLTTIVLNYNTSTMSSTDKLQIVVDEFVEKFEPAEAQLDPVNKFRTSQPQALIDTDFEYGTQVSKWENLYLTNNRPTFYSNPTPITGSSTITGIAVSANARTVTVSLTNTTGLAVGTPIYVQDTLFPLANGQFIIETLTLNTSFTYTAKAINTSSTTTIYDAAKTIIYPGTAYTQAQIGAAPSALTISGNALTVTTTVPHGLAIGNEIYVTGITGTNPPNGNYIVASVLNPTQFIYYANPILGVPSGLTITAGAIFARPQGQVIHRAFDGGVLFSTNSSSNNQQAIRQTRRYFRYQSGKGIQISSGTILKPYASVDSITYASSLVTVQTREQHNITPGTTIVVAGANESAYNGTFIVVGVTAFNKFTYTPLTTPSVATASGLYTVNVTSWSGATNRLGSFDSQNGIFWEFDGSTLYAVRRSSVFQIGGRVSATINSTNITQTSSDYPTAFSKQLVPGDYIVIRGQSYKVMDIESDTSMQITPAYRGTTATSIIVSKTTDTKIASSSFNIDKLDGTGPSGYNIDLSKMQMFYIDYSWYGAGFIRWGVRGPDGNVIYVHKLANNNVNNEAYMRSGNLPAHYETSTIPPSTYATASIGASDTTLTVADTSKFPSSGTLVIRPGSTTNNASKTYECVNYTGKTGTTFTGLTRAGAGATGVTTTWTLGANSGTVSSATGLQIGQRVFSTTNPSPVPDGTYVTGINGTTVTLSNALGATNPTLAFVAMGATAGTAYTYAATSPIAVELAYPTFAPAISHWGTSVIMDGRFDDDKSLLFTYGQNAQTALQSVTGSIVVGGTNSGTISTTIITLSDVSQVVIGMTVSGTGVGTNAVVTGINSTSKQITVSVANSGSVSGNITFTATSATKALFSIRIAPSVDSGIPGVFSSREILNRMQLILRSLDITTAGPVGNANPVNLLVTAVLNGVPSTSTAWTNVVKGVAGTPNSSLAQIADYVNGNTTITGGETTGGFFTSGTTSIDLAQVRDLGNAILGGGSSANSNAGIYPDGPDTLTIVVQNLSQIPVAVSGRLSWTEAQA